MTSLPNPPAAPFEREGRLTIFAHFDPDDRVQPYVLRLLEKLLEVSSRIVFVSTSRLNELERAKVSKFADTIHLRPNEGYDFAMWRYALEQLDIRAYRELVLTNSSVLGPVFPLAPIFERMSREACDFWGMTDSKEHLWHLQSYFLVFKRRTLESQAFRDFWQGVLPFKNKSQTIFSYELGLSSFFVDQGFHGKAFAGTEELASALKKHMKRRRRWNTTLFFPIQLLGAGVPFVKISLLRDNPGKVPLAPVLQVLHESGYPAEFVPSVKRPSLARKLLSPLRVRLAASNRS